MGLPVVESQSRVPRSKGKMVPIVAVRTKRVKPKIRPRESRPLTFFEKDERDGPENDGSTWEENIVVCMEPGDPSRLILRSYYNNPQTNKVIWNEPPPNALHVKDASAEMVRHAMQKLKNHQQIVKSVHHSIEPSTTHDTEQCSSVSHTSSTSPSSKNQPQKFGLFSRNKKGNHETSVSEAPEAVQPLVEKGDHDKQEKGKPSVEEVRQEGVWKEHMAACMSPGDRTKLILRSCFISSLTGKVVWNHPLEGTNVIYASDEAREKAMLNMKEKERKNRAMFEEQSTPKPQTKESYVSLRSKRKRRSKDKKKARSKRRAVRARKEFNEEDTFLQFLEGCAPIICDDHWSGARMMDLALGASTSSDSYDDNDDDGDVIDDDVHMENENVYIAKSSSTLLASNRTDVMASVYQAFTDVFQPWLGQNKMEDEYDDYRLHKRKHLSTVAGEPHAHDDSHSWVKRDTSKEQQQQQQPRTEGCDFFNSLCNYNSAFFDYATNWTEQLCCQR
jgi:hypothetical protein